MLKANNSFEIVGKIMFDPNNISRKHESQSQWKSVAILAFDGEDHLYYSWFVRKRYGLSLNRPVRGFHVTFVNDRTSDMTPGAWKSVSDRWKGKQVQVGLSTDVRTNGEHWWLKILDPGKMKDIRVELGLSPIPYFTYHATIGYANERNLEDSMRIHRLLDKGMIT